MLKNALAIVAASGLALAPVAVQANTRASAASVSLEALDRQGAPVDISEDLAGREFSLPLIILLFGAAAGVIIAIIESNGGVVVDPPASAGT